MEGEQVILRGFSGEDGSWLARAMDPGCDVRDAPDTPCGCRLKSFLVPATDADYWKGALDSTPLGAAGAPVASSTKRFT